MTRKALYAQLKDIVGEAGLVPGKADQAAYLEDELGRYRGRALAVVRPGSSEEVAAVVAACANAGVAMIPQGGNTGYCGGATPDDSATQVLISLARMNQVESVDPLGYTITVQAGCVLARVQAAAEEHDLLFPLSLGSEGSCQLGGNLSTNAGGLAVLQYGNTRDLVLGLEVVLPDGRVWNGLQALRKDNAGYDLKHLFVGAEGTLGIITRAVLKLYPRPAYRATALVAVPDIAAACSLLAAARRHSGDAVTSFEYLPGQALSLVARYIEGAARPFDVPHEHQVLIELSSHSVSVEADLGDLLERAIAAGSAYDAVIAQSGEQRAGLWRIREQVPEAQRRAGGSYKHDVSVPLGAIPEFMAQASEAVLTLAPQATICAYGHLGDGNLHFNILPPQGQSPAQFGAGKGAAVSNAIHALVREHRGSVCAEHGVGQAKTGLLAEHADPVAYELMRRVKVALDPEGLMNPGKVLQDRQSLP